MAPNKVTKPEESLVDQLCGIAGVSRVIATNLLEACDNNLEMAVNMQMEGVLTDANGASSLQNNDDNVRAPIPQRREILVEGPDHLAYSFRRRSRIGKSVFDKFRDFEAEAKRQEEELEENSSEASSSGSSSNSKRKMKTLEDLFRPPLDLMFRGTFQAAREAGIGAKKWLMVNIQNSTEFPCQVLNRDVWSDSAVKMIIKENFIFWQIYHDSEEGLRYMTFYPVNNWPYIAIIDPRTGEKLVEWKSMDNLSFCDLATKFLTIQPSMEDTLGSDKTPPKKKMKSDDIIEADESAQIEAAIKASLAMTAEEKKKIQTQDASDFESDSDDMDETFENNDEDGDDDDDDADINPDYSSKETSFVDDVDQETKSSSVVVTSVNNLKTDDVSQSSSGESNGNSSSDAVVVVNGSTASKGDDDVGAANADDEIEVLSEIDETCSDAEADVDKWKQYLGRETDPISKLMLRMPDGSRDCVNMPKSSKLMALVLYVASKGFSNESYELVTNFPKRQLSYLDFESTLCSVGLFPQETVFVQKR